MHQKFLLVSYMRRKVFYRYNPETDNYERVYPSWQNRLWVFFRHLLSGIIIGGVIFVAVYYWIDFPKEKILKQQNQQLQTELKILNQRLDRSLIVLDDIANRDNNFYRVMMQADRITDAQRFAGLEKSNRYVHLNDLSDANLIKNVSTKMDQLDRQIYVQIKSFDKLKELAGKQQDRLAHIPAIQPVSELDLRQMASGYGYRVDPVYGTAKFHEGMDFASDIGTPVYATGDARVESAKWHSGYGNLIVLDHGYNYTTRYAHLSEMKVQTGQLVKRGDLIGRVGNTGKSTGPHLHYEVRYKGQPQNPINYYFYDLTPEQYNEMILRAENAGHVMD